MEDFPLLGIFVIRPIYTGINLLQSLLALHTVYLFNITRCILELKHNKKVDVENTPSICAHILSDLFCGKAIS